MKIQIDRFDHIVLTVKSIESSVRFYTSVLGFTEVSYGKGRKALAFGRQTINLHPMENDIEPKAQRPTPGSMDICFVTADSISHVIDRLNHLGIAIEKGPVQTNGAMGPMTSVYFRDPDDNLLEVANYDSKTLS